MWGPPDAVQFAVRQNAERMGIDPANCLDILPGWEGAGDTTKNIITGESKVLGSRTTFNKNNLRTELISASETNPGILDVRTSEFATKNLTLRFDLNVLYVNSNFYNIGGISTAGYDDYRFQIRTSNTDTTVFSHRITGSSLKNIHICSNSALRAANSITATYDGSWLRAYLDRDLIYSENSPGEVDVSGTCYLSIGQQANRASRTLSMDLYCFSYFSQTLSPAQIAQLHETPYALLMPVSRPFIFDMAGGGGLAAPTLTSPAQFSTQSQPVTLEWQAVTGATKYQVQVAEDNLFTTPVVDQIVTGGTTLGVDGLATNTEHFWRVRAGDDN
jgi:hypothetical protein